MKQNDTNMQAFIYESLDNVLPKFRQHAKILLDFLHFAKDFEQNHAKENGTVQKNNVFYVHTYI